MIKPNIRLFSDGDQPSTQPGHLYRCSFEVYMRMVKEHSIDTQGVYFVSYSNETVPSSTLGDSVFSNVCVFTGYDMVGNSGVIFRHALNGLITVNDTTVDITNEADLSTAIQGLPGQVLFVVNEVDTDEGISRTTSMYVAATDPEWSVQPLTRAWRQQQGYYIGEPDEDGDELQRFKQADGYISAFFHSTAPYGVNIPFRLRCKRIDEEDSIGNIFNADDDDYILYTKSAESDDWEIIEGQFMRRREGVWGISSVFDPENPQDLPILWLKEHTSSDEHPVKWINTNLLLNLPGDFNNIVKLQYVNALPVIPENNTVYLINENYVPQSAVSRVTAYTYNNGWFKFGGGVGIPGTGTYSNIFNATPNNKSYGNYSSSFGIDTTAYGTAGFICGNGNYYDNAEYNFTCLVHEIDRTNKIITFDVAGSIAPMSVGSAVRVNNCIVLLTSAQGVYDSSVSTRKLRSYTYTGADSAITIGSNIQGWYRGIAHGAYSFVSGNENNAGAASAVFGTNNFAPGQLNLVGGATNVILGDYNLAGGVSNEITDGRSFTFGSANAARSWASGAGGYDCSTGVYRTYKVISVNASTYTIGLSTVAGLTVGKEVRAYYTWTISDNHYGTQGSLSRLGKIVSVDSTNKTITLDGFNFDTSVKSSRTLSTSHRLYITDNVSVPYPNWSYGDTGSESRLQWATGLHSHAVAGGSFAHGDSNYTYGGVSVALGGYANKTWSDYSFIAGGQHNETFLPNSFIGGGEYLKTGAKNQAVFGKYNEGKSTNVFEIGNGTADNNRHNILEVTEDGELIVAGVNISEQLGDINDALENRLAGVSNG